MAAVQPSIGTGQVQPAPSEAVVVGGAEVDWIAITGLNGLPDSDTDTIVTTNVEDPAGTYLTTYDPQFARTSLQSWAHWWVPQLINDWTPTTHELQVKIEVVTEASDRTLDPCIVIGAKRGAENNNVGEWGDNIGALICWESGGNEVVGGTSDGDVSTDGQDMGATSVKSMVGTLVAMSSADNRSFNSATGWDSSDAYIDRSGIQEVGFNLEDTGTHGVQGSGHISFHDRAGGSGTPGAATVKWMPFYRFVPIASP